MLPLSLGRPIFVGSQDLAMALIEDDAFIL
jgi:hypothetical protein